jgi:hypothetical protein
MNNLGQIVGWFQPFSESTALPFFYDGAKIIELSTLFPPNSGWSFPEAQFQMAINDAGQIVGTGFHNGFLRA